MRPQVRRLRISLRKTLFFEEAEPWAVTRKILVAIHVTFMGLADFIQIRASTAFGNYPVAERVAGRPAESCLKQFKFG